jgi:hypothetical protein
MTIGHLRRAFRGLLSFRKMPKWTPSRFVAADAVRGTDILPRALFMKILRSERKRAERSSRRLVLMLVESKGLLKPEDQISTEEIQYALSCATREPDMKGWYQDGAVIGVIFTEIPLAETSDVQILSRRVNHALHAQLGSKVSALDLTFHVFPDHSESDADGHPSLKTVSTINPDLLVELESACTRPLKMSSTDNSATVETR